MAETKRELKEGEINEYGLPHNPRAHGYISQGFPAPGLRRTVRHITGHDAEGKAVFLSTDCGDHHMIMGEQQALANILYSTHETPVEINGDVDIIHAKENPVCVPPKNCTFPEPNDQLLTLKISRHFTIPTAQ